MPLTFAAALTLFVAHGALLAQDAAELSDELSLYEIDAGSSDVYWLVYRSGALARFGHNHVVSVGAMTGRVLLHSNTEESRFEIEIPVEELIVDDPVLRARIGAEFSSEPSDEDIAGTRRNMLSEEVLDAERHPVLRIEGTGPVTEGGEDRLEVTVQLLGRSVPLTIPTRVAVDDDLLEASGEFQLTHEALGMEPFSVMLGALQVAEPLDFSYRIVARRID